jgi:hypothetical protein
VMVFRMGRAQASAVTAGRKPLDSYLL